MMTSRRILGTAAPFCRSRRYHIKNRTVGLFGRWVWALPRISEHVRNERRRRLVAAAWRCAARSGVRTLTVREVCTEAGLSKGAFYGYFDSKRALVLSMLEEETSSLDGVMTELQRQHLTGPERLRRFARATLEGADDAARVQVRADLWAEMVTDELVRRRFSEAVRVRRQALRSWIEQGEEAGELPEIPANALAAILLALADGLMLHAALDPEAFRWSNVRQALDAILGAMSPQGANRHRDLD